MKTSAMSVHPLSKYCCIPSSYTAKVKRSKDKVTRSNEMCAQKHQIYAVNVFRECHTVNLALARRCCQRLHKRTDQRPRKLLIHLTSESSVTSLLSASRNRHRNDAIRGYYINPDLSQAELKLAFEQRQRRRLTRQQTNLPSAGVSDSTVGANVKSVSNDSDSVFANNNDVGAHSSALFSGSPPFLHQDAANSSPIRSTMSPFQ